MKSLRLQDNTVLEIPHTMVMGILNANRDSFYNKSRVPTLEEALDKADRMIQDGAEILDIGGESTRPGSDPISTEEEQNRVLPLIKALKERHPNILLSLDTYHLDTAKKALEAGIDILNDITALRSHENMADLVAHYNVPVILMHMQGEPKNMQQHPHYDNVVEEVCEFFKRQIEYALSKGIAPDRLILDPGIGFGKNYSHNIELIRHIDRLKEFEMPILLAVSRKTFIGQCLGDLPAEDHLEGTMAISVYAALKDIDMVRVHDVRENVRAIRMVEAIK